MGVGVRKRASLLYPRAFLILLGIGVGGCASIQPPDGGPPDEDPPVLRRAVRSKDGHRFRLYWNEYLSLSSQIEGIGLWINPPLPFKASLRGKAIRLRLDSASVGECFAIWGGPGLKDFTAGNALPPTLLWSSCSADSFAASIPLVGAEGKKTIWGVFRRGSRIYRFLGWKGALQVAGLPFGEYEGWAWEDQNSDGIWNLPEPLWLPDSFIVLTPLAKDTLARKRDTSKVDSQAGQLSLPPWSYWYADTLPPAAPRLQLPTSGTALLFFSEPVYLQAGEAFPLCETVWQCRQGSSLVMADSAGWIDTFTVPIGATDTQAFRRQAFWHAGANARTPFLHLRWVDSLYALDTFWVGRKGDRLFLADACFLPGEIWLSPLETDGEVEVLLRSLEGDSILVKLPARKYPVSLPTDNSVGHWRIYGRALYGGSGIVPALSGETLWLPAGEYTLVGVRESASFWRPVEVKGGVPRLISKPAQPPKSIKVGAVGG